MMVHMPCDALTCYALYSVNASSYWLAQLMDMQTEEPDYWPPVKQTPDGLMVVVGKQHDSNAA